MSRNFTHYSLISPPEFAKQTPSRPLAVGPTANYNLLSNNRVNYTCVYFHNYFTVLPFGLDKRRVPARAGIPAFYIPPVEGENSLLRSFI
jgi:hypothetical protein